MTQAFNLAQLGNKVNSSGQLDASTGLVNAAPIAAGGTNNAALAVSSGGILYTDGTKVANSGAGTAGNVLLSGGTGAPTWGVLSAGGALNNVQYLVASGTYTPTAGTSFVIVELVGGAAGSANTGNTTNNGGNGGTTSFGALVSATGGTSGGAGGTGVSGDLNLAAQTGTSSASNASNSGTFYGYGSSAPIYGCPNGASQKNINYGSGTTVVANPVKAGYGVFGGAGGGYARKKILSGFSGVTVTIGAGGAAGSGGTAGTGGICIVWEYK